MMTPRKKEFNIPFPLDLGNNSINLMVIINIVLYTINIPQKHIYSHHPKLLSSNSFYDTLI